MRKLIFILFLSISVNVLSQQISFPKLTSPYFGQKPPGAKAELFAYSLLSAGFEEAHIIFSPDGKEFLYALLVPAGSTLVEPKGIFGSNFCLYSHFENGIWSEPKEFLYNKNYKFVYPFFSPDGNRIFFRAFWPGKNSQKPNSSKIWYIERENNEWSEPKEVNFGKEYKGPGAVYATVAANGNLYFAQFYDGKNGYLYVSRYENGSYALPEKLNDTINDVGGNHPYIAPDESYIIYDSERPGDTYGIKDLYISFRDGDGNWMKPQNLGAGINSKYDDRRTFVSFDGKYLFFTSDRINPEKPDSPLTITDIQKLTDVPANGNKHIYWVNTSFIEDLRKEAFTNKK